MNKLILCLVLAALNCQAALDIDFWRYRNWGPEQVYAGYTYIWWLEISWSFLADCDATLNSCHSAQYTPTGDEVLALDHYATATGGLQNATFQITYYPGYAAYNIGTAGNSPGAFNLRKCINNLGGGNCTVMNGGTPDPVAITQTATVRFFVRRGGPSTDSTSYMKGAFGQWPAGTQFKYHYPGTGYACGVVNRSTDPSDGVATAANFLWFDQCAQVVIPSTATPGTYTVGWTFCLDAAATTGCQNLVYTMVVKSNPQLVYAPPAPVAMPAAYLQTTPCVLDWANPSNVRAGSDCSFKALATGASKQQQGASYWCQDTANPDTTLDAAKYYIDFTNTGGGAQSTGLGFYYDGPKVFYNTARWFNQPQWENCARAISARMTQFGPGVAGFPGQRIASGNSGALGRWMVGPYDNRTGCSDLGPGNTDNCQFTGPGGNGGHYSWEQTHTTVYMNNRMPTGSMLGLRRFNHGVYSATWAPNRWNPEMKNDLLNVVTNSSAGLTTTAFATYAPGDPRSGAYNFETYIMMLRAGEPLSKTSGTAPNVKTTPTTLGQNYQFAADANVSFLMMMTQPNNASSSNRNWGPYADQTWMVNGPMAEQVLAYWEQSHEPRAGQALIDWVDLLVSVYDPVKRAFPYAWAPQGQWCAGTAYQDAATKWYVDSGGSRGDILANCSDYGGVYSEFDAIAAYLPAWRWRNFGGDAYRAFADELFTTGITGDYSTLGYRFKPKPYYQDNHWIYSYLKFRLLY